MSYDFISTVGKTLGLDGRLNLVSTPSYNWVKFIVSKTQFLYTVEILVGQHKFKFKHAHWDSSLLGHRLVPDLTSQACFPVQCTHLGPQHLGG